MRKRVLKTLKAYLLTNKDVLSKKEIEDIEEQIRVVEEYKPKLSDLFRKSR